MKNALKTISKSTLILLRLTATITGTDAAIHEKMFGTTTFIISGEEINDIMKIVKFLC